MELNKVYCGDCLDIMPNIPDNSVDMVLTDIPYGEVNRKSNGLRNLDKGNADTVTFSLEKIIEELCRVTKGSIYMFCGTEQVSEIRKQFVSEGLSTRLIIWEKTNPSPMNGQHLWLSSIECCVYGKKRNATFNEHCKSSVVRFPSGRGKVHPTEKPLKLFECLIGVSSNEGDLVLDPCLGGGTTAVAARNLNRNYIGIELSPEYCKIAEERISNG